jgi:hypothetical protein
MLQRLRHPHILLFLLSPCVAELMTGSAPPGEFFNPVGFIFIVTWYGCGALLIREIAFRKNLNWKGILLLGMGFGILEEAIFVKTFFDPNAIDLGVFALFGRYLGTNIVWAVYLTFFHAVHSILFPIMLTYLFFKEECKRPWLSQKKVALCSVVLGGLSLFGWFFSDPSMSGTPYIPSVAHFLGSLLVIATITIVSLRFTSPHYSYEKIPPKQRRTLIVLGLVTGCLFSLGVFIVAELSKNTGVTIVYLLVIMSAIFFIKKKTEDNLSGFTYFIAGYYSFWAFLGFLQEFNGITGMSMTGIGFIIFFLVVVHFLNSQ